MNYIIIEQQNAVENKATELKAYIEGDYNGNIYIRYNGIYYIVFLDIDSKNGIELIKIENIKYYNDIYNENIDIYKNIYRGNIISKNTTLSGKVYEKINDMSDEEKKNYQLKNNYETSDPHFTERQYYSVIYDKIQDDDIQDDNMYFRFNNIYTEQEYKGLKIANLLWPYPCSFDTIYIDGDIISKNVVSSIERIDGYCTSRLTIYSSGYFRCNFIEKIILSKICVDDTGLIIRNYETVQ